MLAEESRAVGPLPSRWTRVAGYFTILFGVAGILAGIAGAGTFIPYRTASTFNPSLAEVLTVISALGAIASLVAVISAWGLLRSKNWGATAVVGSALGCVLLNVAVTALWTEYYPFTVVVAVAYGFVALLLWAGRSTSRAHPARPLAG